MQRLPRTPAERAALRETLERRCPWVVDEEVGPRTVEAGECDRCNSEARLVAVCGPRPWQAIGRRCAFELGEQAWCAGHADDAARHLRVLESLPPEADLIARLWWVATGEVHPVDGGLADLDLHSLGNMESLEERVALTPRQERFEG